MTFNKLLFDYMMGDEAKRAEIHALVERIGDAAELADWTPERLLASTVGEIEELARDACGLSEEERRA